MSGARSEPLSPERFAEETGVSRETLERLGAFLSVLTRWQGRINLVGRSTLEDPWRRHILDSAQISPLIVPGAKIILDLGSGAGLPGLILAIMRPDQEVHLVEADSRKCAFLREAARLTGAKPIIHPVRIERLDPFPCDVVTARALAPLERLLAMAFPFLHPESQCLFLKGSDADRELTEAAQRWNMRVERVPSRSDPEGVVLRLWEIVPASDLRDRQPKGRGRKDNHGD